MAEFKIPVLFPDTNVTKLTWYWLLGPCYLMVNLGVVLTSPDGENLLLTYLLMCAGSGAAIWMYPALGLIDQYKVKLGDWQNPMLIMWLRGTILVALTFIGIPVALQMLGTSRAQTVQILIGYVMPVTVGFLMVSGFGMMAYAVLYQSSLQILKFRARR